MGLAQPLTYSKHLKNADPFHRCYARLRLRAGFKGRWLELFVLLAPRFPGYPWFWPLTVHFAHRYFKTSWTFLRMFFGYSHSAHLRDRSHLSLFPLIYVYRSLPLWVYILALGTVSSDIPCSWSHLHAGFRKNAQGGSVVMLKRAALPLGKPWPFLHESVYSGN